MFIFLKVYNLIAQLLLVTPHGFITLNFIFYAVDKHFFFFHESDSEKKCLQAAF